MKKRRRWLYIVFWGLLLLSTMGFGPPEQANETIELEIRAGFGGNFRPGKWTPVQVTVRNSGSDIRGTLQVRAEDVGGDVETLYQVPLTVARNNPKTVFVYISLEDQHPEIVVELLNRDGHVLKREVDELNQIRARDTLYAVITESPDGPLTMTRRTIGAGTPIQVNWSVRDLPAEPNALRSLDVITFFDVRNGRLNTEQQAALEAWVESGGHLIVHGGLNWSYAEEFLAGLLPTTLETTQTINSLAPLGFYLGHPAEILTNTGEGVIVTQNFPHEDAQVLLEIEGVPIIVRQQIGAGVVDFVAFDPHTAPLDAYTETDTLWFELVSTAPPRPSWSHSFEDWSSANNAIRIITGYDLPSALQMLGFLMVYTILIGPLNYIVLWRIGKRELAWFTIPAFIGIFSVVAYFTGFSLRGSAATVNHLAVVQVWPDTDTARVDGLIGVFSPRRTTYDLEVNEAMTLRTIPGVRDGDIGLNAIPVVEGENYRITDLPVDAGIVASFTTSGYLNNAPHIDGQATWTLTQSEHIQLDGYVINTQEFELKDAVLLYKDGFQVVGTLEPGQTERFNMTVRMQEPTWFPLGNRRDIGVYTTTRTFMGRPDRNRRPYNSPYRPYDCSAGGYNAMMAEALFGQDYDCYDRGGTDSEREQRQKAFLLAAISNEFDYSGGRAGDVYLVGWAETEPFTVSLEGTSQDNRFRTLYIFKLPTTFTYDELSKDLIIPPGLMSWTVIDATGFVADSGPYDLRLIDDEQIIFRFTPIPALQNEPVQRLQLHIEGISVEREVKVALWNWDQGEWEDQTLPLNDVFLNINQPAPYLSNSNAIMVQLQLEERFAEAYVDLIEPILYIPGAPADD